MGAFAAVRVVVFSTFWKASADKGGWVNFYDQAQHARYALMNIFHHFCDWHPPMYFAVTSALLHLTQNNWSIYIFQIICGLVSVVLTYLIARMFFNERISLAAALMMAIEPFWAWHNFLLMTDNLYVPLFLAGFYFWFKFLKNGKYSSVMVSALIFGLTTLTRPNSLLLTLFLSFLLALIFIFREKLKIKNYLRINSFKKLFYCLFIFNGLFFLVLAPWAVRNKIVYDRFTIANIMSTNFYYYNLPPFVSWKEKISYQEAYDIYAKQADRDLGKHLGNSGFNCTFFTNEELNKQLDYYKNKANEVMLGNFPSYLTLHLIRTAPFFLQPGYFEMHSAYTGEFRKPDLTAALMSGNLAEIKGFLKNINLKLIVYLTGVLLWGIISLVSFIALVFSYKDKEKFLFAFFAMAVIIYSALLISPFVIARYRMPLYPFFFILTAYFFLAVLPAIIKKIANKDA